MSRFSSPAYTTFGMSEGEPDALATFTIITGEPNDLIAPIHSRMPVIVKPKDYERWLDPAVTDPAALTDIFTPYPAADMTAYKISKAVNSPKNNKPELLEPVV
jgi:putative SOS response-associated peptidase YedK